MCEYKKYNNLWFRLSLCIKLLRKTKESKVKTIYNHVHVHYAPIEITSNLYQVLKKYYQNWNVIVWYIMCIGDSRCPGSIRTPELYFWSSYPCITIQILSKCIIFYVFGLKPRVLRTLILNEPVKSYVLLCLKFKNLFKRILNDLNTYYSLQFSTIFYGILQFIERFEKLNQRPNKQLFFKKNVYIFLWTN